MNIKAYFLKRVRKNISKYRLLNKLNSAFTIMCYYQRGASCLMNLGRFVLGRLMWARCLGASFMWNEVVLHPYNLYSVCNAYVISRLLHRTRGHPNTVLPTN